MTINDVIIFIRDIISSNKYSELEPSFSERSILKRTKQISHFLETSDNYEMITLLSGDDIIYDFVFREYFIIDFRNGTRLRLYELDLSKNDVLNFDDDILVNTIKHGRFVAEEIKYDQLISTLKISKSFFYEDR